MTQSIITLLSALYILTGLIIAHSASNWIQTAIEQKWRLDKESAQTINSTYSKMNNGLKGKLLTVYIYITASIIWLPFFIFDRIRNVKGGN